MRKFLNKYFLFFLLTSLIIGSGCSRRPKDVLKSSEMTDVLVDIHIADGVFSTYEFRHLEDQEKINYYNSILAKHGITQAQFDSSLVWYSHDPKRFEKVYNNVVKKLTKNEEEVKNGKYHDILPSDTLPKYAEINIWNDPTLYEFNKKGNRNNLYFVIKDSMLMTHDNYLLSFRQRTQPTDSCKNQRTVLYVHYADGNIDSLSKEIKNDGKLRHIKLKLVANRNAKIDSLSGFLASSGNCPAIHQSAYIDSISLMRGYNPSIQEKLKSEMDFLNSPFSLLAHPDDKFIFF